MGRINTPHEKLVEMAYKAGAVSKAKKEENKRLYDQNPTRCLACGEPLPYERRKCKFCNNSCAAKYNNTKRNDFSNSLEIKYCKNCGKPLVKKCHETYQRFIERNYCDNTCRYEHAQNDFISKWKAGEISGTNSDNEIHDRIRTYMLEKANYKCTRCGWSEVNPATGKVPVQIHHKDGDCTNNKEDNLEVLCPNCHSLTPTYGAINKGSGRFKRLKYKTKDYLLQKVNEEFTGDMPK